MGDHARKTGHRKKCRAARGQAPPAGDGAAKLHGLPRPQKQARALGRQVGGLRHFGQLAGPGLQVRQYAEPDEGEKHLALAEARDQIEQGLALSPREPPQHRHTRRETVESP